MDTKNPPLLNRAKEAVGKAAAELVSQGMVVGLGTGSTANCFITALGERCRAGLRIQAVCTSKASEKFAIQNGIPVLPLDEAPELNLCIDGADEIDSSKRMIKGGGGALLREKIVAYASKEMIVIVDEHKVVDALGKFPLPVEIVPFGATVTLRHLNQLGLVGSLRKNKAGHTLLTDNGNYIVDIPLAYPVKKASELERSINKIPGVVETGFFIGIAGRVLIGGMDGTVRVM